MHKRIRLQDYNIQKGDTLSLNQSVSEADVTIVLPKGEQTLSTKAVCTSTGILGAALYWTDTKDQPVSGKAHYYPWCYKAHLTLTAMPGYYLTADTGVKINGEDVAQTSLGSDGSLTFAKQYESTTLKLLGIVAPQPVTGVASGTEMTAEALGLPKEVTIETDSAAYTTAGVIWDLDHLVDGSYDPSLITEQHFTVKGSVNLPEEVMNTDGIATEVTLDVTVQAAGVTGAV